MKIGIFGAGAIGCYVGGRLAHAGNKITLFGRQSLVDLVHHSGMVISDCDGFSAKLSTESLAITSSVNDLKDCAVVIVTVKSNDTASSAVQLAPVIRERDILVVSLQNGVGNSDVLAGQLSGNQVSAAMVPFNVLRSENKFHRGTSGSIVVSSGGGAKAVELVHLLNRAGIDAKLHADISGVLWGKLLLNLNNALNALSGLPIREQLGRRDFRLLFARCIEEALGILKKAGIKPISTIGPPAAVVAKVLKLPDFLFFRVASTMLKIDPLARSSTWQDLQAGKKTEIDFLNGEILKLAEKLQTDAPLNKRVVSLIKKVESEKKLPTMTPDQILSQT